MQKKGHLFYPLWAHSLFNKVLHFVYIAIFFASMNMCKQHWLNYSYTSLLELKNCSTICSFRVTSKDLQERPSPCWPQYVNYMQASLGMLSGLASPSCRADLCNLNTCLLTLKGQNSVILAFEHISFYIFFSKGIYII